MDKKQSDLKVLADSCKALANVKEGYPAGCIKQGITNILGHTEKGVVEGGHDEWTALFKPRLVSIPQAQSEMREWGEEHVWTQRPGGAVISGYEPSPHNFHYISDTPHPGAKLVEIQSQQVDMLKQRTEQEMLNATIRRLFDDHGEENAHHALNMALRALPIHLEGYRVCSRKETHEQTGMEV